MKLAGVYKAEQAEENRLFLGSFQALAIAATLTGFSMPAMAHTENGESNIGASENLEIIVTAQRRSERLADVPSSVAVISGQRLELSGVGSLDQIGGLVPGVTISPPAGLTTSIYVRGVGSDSRNIGFDSRVGVYIDGVYAGQSPAVAQDLVDIARVELLRGPQGTLFGKNSLAGAINIITNAPGEQLMGALNLRGGYRDSFSLSGYVNLPLAPKVNARVSGSRIRRDGWVDNLYDGSRLGNTDETALRGQIGAEILPEFSANLAVSHQMTRSRVFIGDNLTNTFATALDNEAPGSRQVMFSTTPAESRKLSGAALALKYELPNGTQLISNTSYRYTKYRVAFDEDWSSARLFSADYLDRYRAVSQEFQIVSHGDKSIRYLVGLYYQHQKNNTERQVFAGADIFTVPFGINPNARVSNAGDIRIDSFAAFFDLTIRLGDRLESSIGTRYSHDRKRVDWLAYGAEMPAFNLATGRLADQAVDDDVSPSVSLSYRLDSASKLYLRYSEGYKSGGFNLDFVSADVFPARLRFDKETVHSLEVGWKLQGPNLPFSLSLAAFHSRYSNYQVNQFQDLGGGRTAIVIANAASVQSRGIEIDALVKPTRTLQILAAAAFIDARFLSFPGGGAGGADVSGNRLPYASRFSASATVNYAPLRFSFLGGNPTLQIDVHYRSGFFTSVDNVRTQQLAGGGSVRFGHVNGYAIANAAIGIEWKARNLRLGLWSRNLFEKTYTSWMVRDFMGTIVETTSEPRTFGLEVQWRF